MIGKFSLIVILLLANIFSGVSVVYSKHAVRKSFIELQNLQNNYDELQIEWGQLQLEQSAWSTHARIEKLAREKLGMDLVHENRLLFLKSE